MKIIKSILILIILCFSAPILSVNPEETDETKAEKRKDELEQLQNRKNAEKLRLKSFKEILGNSVVDQLINKKSDTEKNSILNTLPYELRASLIENIEQKVSLLDQNEEYSQDLRLINDLYELEDLIVKNLKDAQAGINN